MINSKPGNDQTGAVRLERRPDGTTRQNELSMRRLSQWLTDNPQYRSDLA
jgi:hypothetical protein